MKVLFTTPMLEYPPKSGPHLRIDNSIKALNRIADLHILSGVPKFILGRDTAVTYYKSVSEHFGFLPSVNQLSGHKWLRRTQKLCRMFTTDDADFLIQYAKKHQIDVIWFGYGNLSYPLIKKIHQKSGIKSICDTDSVWSRFIHRELPFIKEKEEQNRIQRAVKAKELEERNWVRWCDVTLAVSEVDADYYRSISPDANKIEIFPNAIDMAFYQQPSLPPKPFHQPAVILSGSFGKATSPMNRAADWVLQSIWPLVLKDIPQAHLYIVGNHSDVSYAHIQHPNITIAGRVPSILPYLQHANAAITPLQFESGTRFKILEAGACHLPMISTTLGAEGLDVKHGEEILLADEAEDFARQIVYILNNPEAGKRMAQKCFDFVTKDFSLNALTQHAERILSRFFSHEDRGFVKSSMSVKKEEVLC